MAGGLGTRLRPRTNFIPKPLLPVAGRPLLWYSIDTLSKLGLVKPLVVLAYKGDLIRSFFENEKCEFLDLPDRTMAEAVLTATQLSKQSAVLGMSCDVLLPPRAVSKILSVYQSAGNQNTVLFTRLPEVGHKKWDFVVDGGYLKDIRIRDTNTNLERVLLILKKSSLEKVGSSVVRPISEGTLVEDLRPFQTGWILLLKLLIGLNEPIHSEFVDIPVWNINVPKDLERAEEFVKTHLT